MECCELVYYAQSVKCSSRVLVLPSSDLMSDVAGSTAVAAREEVQEKLIEAMLAKEVEAVPEELQESVKGELEKKVRERLAERAMEIMKLELPWEALSDETLAVLSGLGVGDEEPLMAAVVADMDRVWGQLSPLVREHMDEGGFRKEAIAKMVGRLVREVQEKVGRDLGERGQVSYFKVVERSITSRVQVIEGGSPKRSSTMELEAWLA